MASRADNELLKRWDCQRDDEDWDEYLARMGDPPPHIHARPICIVWLRRRRWMEGRGLEWGGGGRVLTVLLLIGN